jgi:hypothetical protein
MAACSGAWTELQRRCHTACDGTPYLCTNGCASCHGVRVADPAPDLDVHEVLPLCDSLHHPAGLNFYRLRRARGTERTRLKQRPGRLAVAAVRMQDVIGDDFRQVKLRNDHVNRGFALYACRPHGFGVVESSATSNQALAPVNRVHKRLRNNAHAPLHQL